MNKWEILNKLFGWDYVNFTPRTASYYGSNINGGNYRLRIGYNGEVFFYMDGRAMSITDFFIIPIFLINNFGTMATEKTLEFKQINHYKQRSDFMHDLFGDCEMVDCGLISNGFL